MTVRAAPADRRSFPAGTVLIRQGEAGDRAWILEDGEVEVIIDTPLGARRMAVLGRGALVGEMALIDDGVRSATVRAIGDVTAVELGRDMVRRHIEAGPPLGAYLLESLINAIRRAHGVAVEERQPGSSPIRSTRSIGKVLDRRAFPDGHVFFRQGDQGTTAFLIQTGQVSIRRNERELALLGPGRIFGELALLRSQGRTGAALAVGQTTCEVIRRDDFKQALAAMPPILRSLTKIYVEMLSDPLYLMLSAKLRQAPREDGEPHPTGTPP